MRRPCSKLHIDIQSSKEFTNRFFLIINIELSFFTYVYVCPMSRLCILCVTWI